MTISVVQHGSQTATITSGTTLTATVTLGGNITAGNTLVAFAGIGVGNNGNIASSGFTTNGSPDNWQYLGGLAGSFTDWPFQLAMIDPASAGGTNAVVFTATLVTAATTSGSATVLVDVFEIGGLGPHATWDDWTFGDPQATGTAWTSGSVQAWFQGSPADQVIRLGSVMFGVTTANTTTTLTGPSGIWTNETTLTSSLQQGGTGTASKFNMAQLSGFSTVGSAGGPLLAYPGTSTQTGNYVAWAVSLYNGAAPFFPAVRAVQARRIPGSLRLPGAGPRGRVSRSPGQRAGVTYYVAGTGSDSNSGQSPSKAWQTITRVNGATLLPGDTVLFNGGDTFTGLLEPSRGGTAMQPVTFGSYGTGQATLTNSTDSAVFINEIGGVTFQNLTFTGPGSATAAHAGLNIFNDLAFQQPAITITNCTATGWTAGVLIGANAAGGGYNGITITGCTTSANRDAGINIYGSGSSSWADHSNVTITGCTANSNTGNPSNTTTSTGHGIVVGNTTGGSITQCVASGNGAQCGCTSAGPVGIWCYTTKNFTIANCVSYQNKTANSANVDGDGFDLDDQCIGCTIEYCVSYQNAGAGILLISNDATWTGNTVRYNITWGNGQSSASASELLLFGTSLNSSSIYGNTFIGQDDGAAQPPVINLNSAAFTAVNLWNNIVYCGGHGSLVFSDAAYTGVTFQGNLYYSAVTFAVSWNGTGYASLGAWRTGTSQEILSGHNTGQQANPQFNAPGTVPAVTSPSNLAPARGLQLAPGSPAAAQGLNLGSLFSITPGAQDVFGNPVAYPLWVGAFQGLLVPPAGIPVRARVPQFHPRAGRIAAANRGGPVSNPPTQGPPFRPLRWPARIRPSLPPRGRSTSNPGGPARNPSHGPVFRQPVRPIRGPVPQVFSRGRGRSTPPYVPPPYIGIATPIAIGLTLTAGGVNAWQYIGPVPLTYLQYMQPPSQKLVQPAAPVPGGAIPGFAVPGMMEPGLAVVPSAGTVIPVPVQTLQVTPGEIFTELGPASGYPYFLPTPPPDGRWVIVGGGGVTHDFLRRPGPDPQADDLAWDPPEHLAHLPVPFSLIAKRIRRRALKDGEAPG